MGEFRYVDLMFNYLFRVMKALENELNENFEMEQYPNLVKLN